MNETDSMIFSRTSSIVRAIRPAERTFDRFPGPQLRGCRRPDAAKGLSVPVSLSLRRRQ